VRTRLFLAAAVIAGALSGCGAAPDERPSPSASPLLAAAPSADSRISTGWEITVYYTAVEEFHHGSLTKVTGCPGVKCAHGTADLGAYPADFVQAVHDEGTGRTSDGHYLNWSYNVGYWLDSAPRSSDGGVLTPYVSAAADPNVLPRGTRLTIADCGRADDGSTPAAEVCAALRRAAWRITDEFTPGLGGPRHIDAYIGAETGPGFTESDWYITLVNAGLSLG